jgi:hypothetical protein
MIRSRQDTEEMACGKTDPLDLTASCKRSNEVCRFNALSFDQIRPVITIELNGGLIYSVTNIFSTDIHVI